jgi:hypothetical protein
MWIILAIDYQWVTFGYKTERSHRQVLFVLVMFVEKAEERQLIFMFAV